MVPRDIIVVVTQSRGHIADSPPAPPGTALHGT